MRATIIRDDNAVTVDGVRFEVGAVALLAADIHAIQWDGVRGEIEYAYVTCAHCGVGSKKPNEAITDFSPYQPLLDAHAKLKAAAELAAADKAGTIEPQALAQ